ncbi:Thiolase, N-terminal domain-containing protein [Podospora didyma]|uniref:acetyl-CoA C-acyltransferase n=1 Tax=Podospora didyma TaxID=330526 RepID=A0AAE0NI22_9PEZI|nr:Thiolase, N-terminal domain-containing protein [Podospora didyma]
MASDSDDHSAQLETTIPSTEAPNSPAMDPSASFRTELNDDRLESSVVIPSSLTPPPSSQSANHAGAGMVNPLPIYVGSQRSGIFSPPATGIQGVTPRTSSEYTPPEPLQVAEASSEELRIMVQLSITEHARLKMEAAHHKLQFSLLSLQADEDAKRAAVEHEMIRMEVDALRKAEHTRQARRDLNDNVESVQAQRLEIKVLDETLDQCRSQMALLLDELDMLHKKAKAARKVIQQKDEQLAALEDERDLLLNRIRENREHLNYMCSPGGLFHGAIASNHATDHGKQNFAVLLQALSQGQENNSAPTTPIAGFRPAARLPSKHTRNVQSMSSLPTTPVARSRLEQSGLLPSVNLVPQTEPAYRQGRFVPETPTPARSRERRNSRESTISAEDNEELARQALQSVAAASFMASQTSLSQRSSHRQLEEEDVFESQASQAASEMLRRDPRESFEVASSVGNSRDVTPAPAEKSAKLQAKLYGGLNKSGLATAEKRKFSGEELTSPAAKMPRLQGVAVLAKAPTDVVILSSLRTPICRSYRGQLKDAYPEELLSVVLRGSLDANPNLDKNAVDDVAVGVVLSELGGSKAARMALNHVGFNAERTSLYTTNRACASSLQSIALVAAQIQSGMIDVGIGAGMESMTRNYGSRAIPVDAWPALKESPVKEARDCVMPMGLTSENVAKRYNVSRADQDVFSVESHARAARARSEGRFKDEIVPVTTRFQETDKAGNKVGEEKTITVTEDDGIRVGVTLEALAKLKPAFSADGASTAGNSSQVSDGAAATLLMRRSTATALGLEGNILGKFVGAAVAGCKPDEMGVGPAIAIPKLLAQLGIQNSDVHRWEINEAFASQAIHCVRELGLEKDWEQGNVNPDGGAIALGHPLGATGARLTSTLLHGLKRTGGEVGVVSMCIGTGMGMAGVFVRE